MIDTKQQFQFLSTLGRIVENFSLDMQNVARAFVGMETLDRPVERAVNISEIWSEVWEECCMGYNGMDNVVDIYLEGTEAFAVTVKDGKLYKISLSVDGSEVTLGEPQEVIQQFTPVNQDRFTIFRQADGRIRFTSLAATATLNRSGAIDGVDLFDSMSDYDYTKRGMPYLTYWHNGKQLRMGQVDYMWRDGFCYFNTGLFDEDFPFAEDVARSLETDGSFWGVSIGFMPTSEPVLADIGGIKIPVYQAGYQVELSILPEKSAASNLTRISVHRGKAMNDKQREGILKLVGGDKAKADALIAQVDNAAKETNRSIQEKGMITRDAAADPTPAASTVVETPAKKDEVETVIDLTEDLVNQIAETILQSKNFVDIDVRLQELENNAAQQRAAGNAEILSAIAELRTSVEDRLTKLEATDVEKLTQAVADSPSRSKVTLTYRAREQRAEQARTQITNGGTLMSTSALPANGVRQDVV